MDTVQKIRSQMGTRTFVLITFVILLSALSAYAYEITNNVIKINEKAKVVTETYKSNNVSEEAVAQIAEEEASKLSAKKSSSSSSSTGSDSSSNDSGSSDGSTTPEGSDDPGWVWDETPPVLSNMMVNFADYNPVAGTAGDFLFDAQMEKAFGEFGRTVSSPSGPKSLPQFDFFVTQSTSIVAPVGGEVVLFTYQPSTTDYSIHIRPTYNSAWLINYDHIRNVPGTIVEGATITAGQYIGTPGSWFYSGFFELMVTYDKGDGNGLGYCPYNYLSSGIKATYSTKINNLMSQWETFKGDSGIYDEGAMVAPGCLTNTSPL